MDLQGAPLHEVSSIETPEQIEVHLQLAGVASRAVAYGIDLLWQTVPLIAMIVGLFALAPFQHAAAVEQEANQPPTFTLLFQAVVALSLFVVNFGYFAFFELVWHGQTPGKRAMGLRVVKDGGYPLDGRAALVRNFLRVVDFLPSGYFLGMAVLFAGRQGKRAGDYAAGTLVICEPIFEHTFGHIFDHTAALPLARPSSPSGRLSAEERRWVSAFIERRDALEPDARDRVAAALATRLAARLGEAPPAAPEVFLEALLNDHDHDHGR